MSGEAPGSAWQLAPYNRGPFMRRLRLVLAVFAGACILVLALLLWGRLTLPPEDRALAQTLQAWTEEAPLGATLELAPLLPAGTTQVAIFGAYASNNVAQEALGFPFDIVAASPWAATEGGHVIVAASDGAALSYTPVSNGRVTFACDLGGASVPIEDADLVLFIDGYGERTATVVSILECARPPR